jgi:hypothetical protein
MVNHQADRYEGWTPETFERFKGLFDIGDDDEHWLWRGPNVLTSRGTPIPTFSSGITNRSAALYVYDMVIGLPDDPTKFKKVLRQCDEPRCVNPHHRELRLYEHPKKRLGPKPRRNDDEHCRGAAHHNLKEVGGRTSSGMCRGCKREQNERWSDRQAEWKQRQRQDLQDNWYEHAERRLAEY